MPHAFFDVLAGLLKFNLFNYLSDPAGLKASLDTPINNDPTPRQYETSCTYVSPIIVGAYNTISQGRGSTMVLDFPDQTNGIKNEAAIVPGVRMPALELTLPG